MWCDAILTINVDRPVIEYNVCSNNCYAVGAYASIWPHSSNNALMQFNEVYDTRYVGGDRQAFDVDYNCDDAIVQYNYSHDNEGGFAGNGVIANNIFYAKEKVNVSAWKMDAKLSYTYDNNAVYQYTSYPDDNGLITANPRLSQPGSAALGIDSGGLPASAGLGVYRCRYSDTE